jgi:hypothetical protein
MKNSIFISVISILILTFSFTLLTACSDNNDNITDDLKDQINDQTDDQTLLDKNKEALLFMLEEEKLARDTYIYLNNIWSINQFANIQKSEQTHMDAIENLLIKNNINYSLKPTGKFSNQTLQNHYNQFVIDGAISKANAMQIGATIEDLDIKDLQGYIDLVTDQDLINVFENLKCGSRNHLRSFVSGIEKDGNTYIPQFITQDEYDTIIAQSHEKCN